MLNISYTCIDLKHQIFVFPIKQLHFNTNYRLQQVDTFLNFFNKQ